MITPLYLESRAKHAPLRVGVLIDGPAVPRYVAAILEDIARSNFAEVRLAVEVKTPRTAADGSRLLYQLYSRVDHAAGGELDPLRVEDAPVGLVGVDRLEVSAGGPSGQWLPDDVLSEIGRRELDVLLRFCTPRPRGAVLHAARHGVWSYHFGADQDAREGVPFLQQVVEQTPTRDVLLEVLQDEPGTGLVLCRSTFGGHGNLMLAHYRRVAFWETTHFVLWKLHDLHEHGWQRLREQAVSRAPRPRPASIATTPSNAEMFRFLAPRVTTAVANRVRGERLEHGVHIRWQIALRKRASPFGATRETTSLDGFRWLDAPAGHYWADPFLVQRGGDTFLLFEDYDYAKHHASIRGAEVRPDGTLGEVFPCLDLGYHLSFPNVFEHDGEMFMIPESLSDGTVTLYRARRFPGDWVPEKVLFRGNAADTTPWRRDGRVYFFTTLHDRDDRGMKTMLFTADSLTSEWRLHPCNAVSSDVRHARNAGAVFSREGRLFRPSQDCGPGYGWGMNLEEILTLSEDRYEEHTWCSVGPGALAFPAIGVHTYNSCGDYEVIDACHSLGPRRRLPSWFPGGSVTP